MIHSIKSIDKRNASCFALNLVVTKTKAMILAMEITSRSILKKKLTDFQ